MKDPSDLLNALSGILRPLGELAEECDRRFRKWRDDPANRDKVAFLHALLTDPDDTLITVSAHLAREAFPDMTESMTTEDIKDLIKRGDDYKPPPVSPNHPSHLN